MNQNKLANDRPYSLIVKDLLFGSSSMSFAKCVGEKIDDCFDAGSFPNWLVIQGDREKKESDHLLLWNYGEDLHQLGCLLGLGAGMKKKDPSKIGFRTKGTLATIWHLGPKKFTALSRDPSKEINELVFNTGAYIHMLKTKEKNYRDPALLPENYHRNQIPLTISTKNTLEKLIATVKNGEVCQELRDILEGGESFLLLAMEFDPMHRLYGQLDEKMRECLNSFNLYHASVLKADTTHCICYYPPDGSDAVILDQETAIDLIRHDEYIQAKVEVRCDEQRETKKMMIRENDMDVEKEFVEIRQLETVLKVDLSIHGKPEEGTKTFYITDKPVGNYKNSAPVDVYPQWNKRVPYGSFEVNMTQLSVGEDNEQMAELAAMKDANDPTGKKRRKDICSDFTSTDDLRGVCVEWNGRLLGRPWWSADWGAEKNAGPLRCVVKIRENHYLAETLFKIQGDKSEFNLDEANPVVTRLFEHLIKNPLSQLLQSTKKPAHIKGLGKNHADYLAYKMDWTKDIFELIRTGKMPATARSSSGSGSDSTSTTGSSGTSASAGREQTKLFDFKKKTRATDSDSVTSERSGTNEIVESPVAGGNTHEGGLHSDPNDHTKVSGHIRLTPKSPRDIVRRMRAFYEKLSPEILERLEKNASTETVDGMTRHFKNLNELDALLAGMMV